MKLDDILDKIELEVLNDINVNVEFSTLYIGDLLSSVMANGKEHALWLTVQRHINVIAVASLNDFAGIIFVENVEPNSDTIAKATELHIPLMKTSLDAYQLSCQFIKAGL